MDPAVSASRSGTWLTDRCRLSLSSGGQQLRRRTAAGIELAAAERRCRVQHRLIPGAADGEYVSGELVPDRRRRWCTGTGTCCRRDRWRT